MKRITHGSPPPPPPPPPLSISTFFNDPRSFFDEFHRSVFDDTFFNQWRAFELAPSQSGASPINTISSSLRPRLDLHQGPDGTVTATFELPGLKKEDIWIDVQNDLLTVSGQVSLTNEATSDESSGTWHIRERRFGKFSRTLQLPPGTRADKIKATHTDGILTVTLPKATHKQEPKRIKVS